MSLSLYKKKRKFNETPEPKGREEGSAGELRFVVQKHDASHLHYDFRLELRGTLKSWAVPKGPSMNPEDKRLAMMVEDHPYTYKDFEGIIPEGNYGAGTVIIWDEGTYEPLEPVKGGKAEMEKKLMQGLHKGDLKFVLHGKKLKGAFVLVHTKGRGDNAWLLIKKKDEYARDTDITKKNKSVISGQTIEQVAKTSTNEWQSNRTAAGKIKKGTGGHPAANGGSAAANGKRRASTSSDSTNGVGAVADARSASSAKKARASSHSTNGRSATAASGKKTATSSGSRSVINGNTQRSRSAASGKKTAVKKKPVDPRVQQGVKTSFPADLTPMLATLTDHPFDDADWIFEIKWDGYRALAYLDNGQVELRSRNNISFNERYAPVVEALEELGVHAVLDGEITSMNEKGRSDFQQLQIWQKEHKGELQFYVFDLLWLDGYSLTDLPLVERKAILKDIIPPDHPVIKYSDHIEERGKEFFELAKREGLEGTMAKLAAGSYHPGVRTQQWLKIKTEQRQEAIICGFTQPRRSRKLFGALVLGIYDKDELVYIGHTGSGFTEKTLKEMYKKLEPIITDKCPFRVKPITNMPCTWVKPKYVCEVKYTEWTKDNSLRHPIFVGLREDKDPSEVKKEVPISADPDRIEEKELQEEVKPARKSGSRRVVKNAVATKKKVPGTEKPANRSAATRTKASGTKKPTGSMTADSEKKSGPKKSSASPKLLQDPLFTGTEKDQTVILNGHEFKCTNLNKPYWRKEKITKKDVIEYYHAMSPLILPYMKDRPQSLNRHPDGSEGPNFFQKDVAGKVADWLTTYTYVSESDGEKKKFLVCSDEASLIYMANLGCIEMNPWHSRTASADQPDWCVIDLDPDKTDFAKVIETAHIVKQVTDGLGMNTCCKTSGSRGLHIYIPLGAKYSYDQSRQLAELVVTLVNQELPDFTSVERNPARRRGKIYLDFLQNRSIQTIAAPYSLRPRPGATVSTPLHWEEVKKGLAIANFTIFNIRDRVKEMGDIFRDVLDKGIDLEKVLKKAGSLMGG